MKKKKKLIADILQKFSHLESNFVYWDFDKKILTVEQDFQATGEEKNDDDCCDEARECGEEIVEAFPQLELIRYFCHRHKYSITKLKLS